MIRRVYMDHNATTPVHSEVLEAMLPFFKDQFGNASSIHWAGREVKKYLDEAREKVAALLKAAPEEIVFTGCGTESDNTAIMGSLAEGRRMQRNVDKLLADAHRSRLVSLGEFLEYVQALRDVGLREGEAPVEAGGAVQLMTVHSAAPPTKM